MNTYKDCNSELSVKLIGRITTLLPHLESDLPKQLEIKQAIDSILYDYTTTTKETSIVCSDIRQKAQLYLSCKKLEGLAESTLYNYSISLSRMEKFFNKPVSNINSMDIRMFMVHVKYGVSESTLNSIMSPIRDFFSWLQNENYIISNPTKQVKAIKEPSRLRHPLTTEQVELIRHDISGMGIRTRSIIEFFLATGCRVSELVSIKLRDINWTELTIPIIGKGNKERIIYFNERTKLLLKSYIVDRPGNSEYLFCSDRAPYTNISSRAVQRVVKNVEKNSSVGVRLYPHIFRHTFATRALAQGMSIEILQRIMGHEHIDTTTIYAKVSDENIKYIYNRIS